MWRIGGCTAVKNLVSTTTCGSKYHSMRQQVPQRVTVSTTICGRKHHYIAVLIVSITKCCNADLLPWQQLLLYKYIGITQRLT